MYVNSMLLYSVPKKAKSLKTTNQYFLLPFKLKSLYFFKAIKVFNSNTFPQIL